MSLFTKRLSRIVSGLFGVVFLVTGVSCQTAPQSAPSVSTRPVTVPTPVTNGTVILPPETDLARIVPGHSKRASSWETNGGNKDFVNIAPGKTEVLLDTDGPGVITHIYCTLVEPDVLDFRDAIVRMYWDNETTPSVEVPLGDFFCVAGCTIRHFSSAMMAVNPGGDEKLGNSGYNCYFPMPFSRHARIEIENQSDRYLGGAYRGLWYHIDYELCDQPLPDDLGRFHAQYRQAVPTPVEDLPDDDPRSYLNATGANNYELLDAQGQGHIAGAFLEVDNLKGRWWGECDDMIFIDGEVWPPSIHGTGSEEIFGGGPTPDVEYASLYTGFLTVENAHRQKFGGMNACYRWYVKDPIRFDRSIRMTIEHGHANQAANNYASVVYWYQTEPHAVFPPLPSLKDRRPDLPESFWNAHKQLDQLYADFVPYRINVMYGKEEAPPQMRWIIGRVGDFVNEGCALMLMKDYDGANELFTRALDLWKNRENLR